MIVMGTNTWDFEIDKDLLVEQALSFSENVKAGGIAELREFLISIEEKVLWCTWETENLEGLQAAFDEMNRQSGLTSKLTIVEDMYDPET
jgi:hypothetical protein